MPNHLPKTHGTRLQWLPQFKKEGEVDAFGKSVPQTHPLSAIRQPGSGPYRAQLDTECQTAASEAQPLLVPEQWPQGTTMSYCVEAHASKAGNAGYRGCVKQCGLSAQGFRGKVVVKGDGKWVRLDFPTRLKEPVVFLGTPNNIKATMMIPQVGVVDGTGFSARIMVPPCSGTDLANEEVLVPYLALPRMEELDYFARIVKLTKGEGIPQFGTEEHGYNYKPWSKQSGSYIVLAQIQNMAEIEKGATESITTPYAYAKSDGKIEGTKVFFHFSDPLKTALATVDVALLVVGSSFVDNLAKGQAELKYSTYLTHGHAFSHGLAAPFLPFIHSKNIDVGLTFAVEDCDTSERCTPLITTCQHSGAPVTVEAFYLIIADERTARHKPNAGPSCRTATSNQQDLSEACRVACTKLWSANQDSHSQCDDPMECFIKDFSVPSTLITVLGKEFGVTLVEKLQETCSFVALRRLQQTFCLFHMLPFCRLNVHSQGNCSCPNSGTTCSLEEALWDMSWSEGFPRGRTMLLSDKLKCAHGRHIYNAAATLTRARDGGPQCSELSSSSKSDLQAVLCKNLCVDSWDALKDEAMASLYPYETFSRLQDAWLDNNTRMLPTPLREEAKTCTFEKKPYFAPPSQYERQGIFVLNKGLFTLSEPCEEAYTTKIAGAVFGCTSAISLENQRRSCRVEDVTGVVEKACSFSGPGSGACTIAENSLPSPLELCPTCDDFSLVLYYSCQISAQNLEGYEISIQSLSGNLVYSDGIPSCGCSGEASPATAEEALVLSSWQASMTVPSQYLLGGARILLVDEERKLSFLSWAPSSSSDCQNDSFQVLCKPCKFLIACRFVVLTACLPPEPLCAEAFSTRNTQSSFEDQLCKDSCTQLLQGMCLSEGNQWACVNEHLTTCYIPNSLRKTCGIRRASTEYNSKFRTCGCADDPKMEPCTATEVEYLKFDWASDFKNNVEGKGKLLLMRNLQVMDDTGLVYTMTNRSACQNASKYQGIFCRALAYALADLEPKCREAKSTNADISDYQCAHACVEAYTQCKQQKSTSVAACYLASENGHSILSHCTVSLVHSGIVHTESNMIAGIVTITTDWKRVTFPAPISPDPVVFTGLLQPLGTFGQVQITDVTESGFRIRLALDYCREGYAAAYAKLSWLAMSERRYSVSEAGAAARAGTTVIGVGKETEVVPGVELASSAAILLTQIQDIPSDLPMEDIPFVEITHLDSTSAKFALRSAAANPKQQKLTVAFLFMDQVQTAKCPTACKLNNLALETTSAEIYPGIVNPVAYTQEYFGSHPPLTFGSLIVPPEEGGKKMLFENPNASLLSAMWEARIFAVTNETCKAFQFEEPHGSPLRLVALHVQARMLGSGTYSHFSPNCENAKLKEGATKNVDCVAECTKLSTSCPASRTWECFVKAAAVELKRNCYVEAYVETGLTATTSTTLPPVNDAVKCRVVDMSRPEYVDSIGWNVHAMSCFCPQGFDPCTPAQVEQDRVHWINDVSLLGEICRNYESVQPVAWGFMQLANDICMVKTNLKWLKRPFPLYSFDDINLDTAFKRSGHNQCSQETPFVFCPTASLTTETTTAAPTWDWPQNADCLPGYWEEWSACSATCTPSDPTASVPVRKRRRPQLLAARGNGAPCVLEETVPCEFETPTPCNSLCRHSEWGEWSECSEKLLDFGVAPVWASSREKYVFAEAGEACSDLELREFDKSRCTRSEADSSSQSGIPSALQLGKDDSDGDLAESWSEWSSCDAPCLLDGHDPQRYKLSLKADTAVGAPVYEDTEAQQCPDLLKPCRNDKTPSCSYISPQHDAAENREFCLQNCKLILESCEDEAKRSGITVLQCFVTNISENQTLRGKCVLSAELEREAAPPTCFPSLARANNDKSSNYRFLDPQSAGVQCLCLEPDSVPCTAEEIYESRQLSFASLPSSVCPRQDTAGAQFDIGERGPADSKLYLAAADSGKVFCPMSSSKRQTQQPYQATFSSFTSAAEMNEYCANGLPAQLESLWNAPYDLGLECDRMEPKDSSLTAEDCKAKCIDIKERCSESTGEFLSCVATQRQTTGFDEKCTTVGNVYAGKGIIFCKRIAKDCKYSEWTEWSACSATCRKGPGATGNSVRIRTRQIVRPSSTGGEPCKFGSSPRSSEENHAGTVETEVCSFQKLCDDHEGEALLLFTPKPEPSVQSWSPDTTTTTTTKPSTDLIHKVTCIIVDMSSATTNMGYDEQHRTCKCPSYTRPCSRAEVENSKSSWNQAMMTFCQKNGIATITSENFELFSCDTRTFKELHDFNESTAEEYCSSSQHASVFCVEAEDTEAELHRIAITLLLMLVGGTIVGILVVLWFIQYSVDVQKALGLRGRYVELVNMAKE
ncbi:hypothetical protein Efla_003098 [Eimeria flavescens]